MYIFSDRENETFAEILSELTGTPTFIANCENAAVYSEAMYGWGSEKWIRSEFR